MKFLCRVSVDKFLPIYFSVASGYWVIIVITHTSEKHTNFKLTSFLEEMLFAACDKAWLKFGEATRFQRTHFDRRQDNAKISCYLLVDGRLNKPWTTCSDNAEGKTPVYIISIFISKLPPPGGNVYSLYWVAASTAFGLCNFLCPFGEADVLKSKAATNLFSKRGDLMPSQRWKRNGRSAFNLAQKPIGSAEDWILYLWECVSTFNVLCTLSRSVTRA